MDETSAPSALTADDFPAPRGLKVETPIWVGLRAQWFEALQVRLGRMVAIKFLRPHLAANETFRRAFLEAGRQAALIVHPAALPIINVHPAENCIVMQSCPAKSVQEIGEEIEPRFAAAAAVTIMDCLSALHATNRCHGNITPGNVFIDGAGGVWLNDFFQPAVFRENSFSFVASQDYTAPEVLDGAPPDWRSDVYGMGKVLFTLIDTSEASDEFGMLLETAVSEDPAQRGGSPQSVIEAFKRIKRLEGVRQGRRNTIRSARRMYRRVPAAFDVSLRKRSATPEETQVILMKTRDIGESGVFVETNDESLGVGSILELNFAIKGVESQVHAFGIVRWISSPPLTRGVGVQFVEVDQEGLAKLREYLSNR